MHYRTATPIRPAVYPLLLLFPKPRKRISFRFGLNRGDGFATSEQQVVGFAGFSKGLQGSKHRASGEIGFRPVLNNPTALLEEEINLLPSPLFWGHGWARTAGSVTEKSRHVAWSRKFGGRDRIGLFRSSVTELIL
jgi:hypothetical protein